MGPNKFTASDADIAITQQLASKLGGLLTAALRNNDATTMIMDGGTIISTATEGDRSTTDEIIFRLPTKEMATAFKGAMDGLCAKKTHVNCKSAHACGALNGTHGYKEETVEGEGGIVTTRHIRHFTSVHKPLTRMGHDGVSVRVTDTHLLEALKVSLEQDNGTSGQGQDFVTAFAAAMENSKDSCGRGCRGA